MLGGAGIEKQLRAAIQTHERAGYVFAGSETSLLTDMLKIFRGVRTLALQSSVTRKIFNGNWTGLSLGWLTVIWITYILSEGDHRLCNVEDWVKEHQRTLSKLIGKRVRPRDLNDDRLARVLDYLSVDENWVAFECELNHPFFS